MLLKGPRRERFVLRLDSCDRVAAFQTCSKHCQNGYHRDGGKECPDLALDSWQTLEMYNTYIYIYMHVSSQDYTTLNTSKMLDERCLWSHFAWGEPFGRCPRELSPSRMRLWEMSQRAPVKQNKTVGDVPYSYSQAE